GADPPPPIAPEPAPPSPFVVASGASSPQAKAARHREVAQSRRKLDGFILVLGRHHRLFGVRRHSTARTRQNRHGGERWGSILDMARHAPWRMAPSFTER